ncbi:condensin complex protein MksE [Winogradskyella sp. Asnod2-B02-A]|uniref:condensin complex protein MksE n=1 Tax=Winogradskyella sp. Asnod2-B02-A TaxID=3160583 RepID=UPI003864665B
MGDENTEEVSRNDFLHDNKVEQVFAKLDYALRSGIHIQRDYPKPGELFRFLERNFDSLKLYYYELFQIILSKQGNDFKHYYFIDFEEGNRGAIPTSSRDYLDTEVIIIGMLFFKLYQIDGNIELDTVDDFISTLISEYDDEKEALFKLISNSRSGKSTDFNDEKVIALIKKAFDTFNHLGWIEWEDNQIKNRFKPLPSFERLRILYQSQINNIDQLLAQNENAK